MPVKNHPNTRVGSLKPAKYACIAGYLTKFSTGLTHDDRKRIRPMSSRNLTFETHNITLNIKRLELQYQLETVWWEFGQGL